MRTRLRLAIRPTNGESGTTIGGNLTSLILNIPATGNATAFSYVITYEDHGTTPKITTPTGSQAQKAPALVYEILSS